MNHADVKFDANIPNVAVTRSARAPASVRNAPVQLIYLDAPQPAQQYREEWRTTYYGDHFSRERVMVPVGNATAYEPGVGAAIRGFISWLLGQ